MGNANDTDALPLPGTSFMAGNSNGYNTDKERRLESGQLMPRENVMTHLQGDIDPEQATAPLIAYCFMTGLMCVDHSQSFIICNVLTFQTATLYHSLRYMYGVDSKLVMEHRYVQSTEWTILESNHHAKTTAGPRSRPSIRRARRSTRHHIPQCRSTCTHILNLIRIGRINR